MSAAERNVSSVEAVAEDFTTVSFEVVEISDIATENNTTAVIQFNLDDGRVANRRGKVPVDTGVQGNTITLAKKNRYSRDIHEIDPQCDHEISCDIDFDLQHELATRR